MVALFLLFFAQPSAAWFFTKRPAEEACALLAVSMPKSVPNEIESELQYYPTMLRLEKVFSNTSDRKIRKLFDILTQENFEKVITAAEGGKIELTDEARYFLHDLKIFLKEDPTFLKKGRSRKSSNMTADAVIDQIRTVQKQFIRMHPEMHFQARLSQTVQAVQYREGILLNWAVSFDGIKESVKRFIFPLYRRVQAMLGFNDYIYKQAEVIKAVDELAERLAGKPEENGVTSDEAVELQKMREDSPTQNAYLQSLIADVYGIEVARGNATSQIGLHSIARRLNKYVYDEKVEGPWLDATTNIDRIDAITDFKKIQHTNRDLSLRHAVREWNADFSVKRYLDATDVNPEGVAYTIVHHSVVETRNNKGEVVSRRDVYTPETVYPTYEDILTGNWRYGNCGRDHGLSQVIADAERFVERETPLRNAMNVVEEGMTKKLDEKSVAELLGQVRDILPEIRKYSAWTSSQIKRQYEYDSQDNFKARNSFLLRRYENMEKWLMVVEYSLRNYNETPKPLVIEPNQQARASTLEQLRRIWIRNIVEKSALFTAGAIAGAVYYTQGELSVDALMNSLHQLSIYLQTLLN